MSVAELTTQELGLFAAITVKIGATDLSKACKLAEQIANGNEAAFIQTYEDRHEFSQSVTADEVESVALKYLAGHATYDMVNDYFGPLAYNMVSNGGKAFVGLFAEVPQDSDVLANISKLEDLCKAWQDKQKSAAAKSDADTAQTQALADNPQLLKRSDKPKWHDGRLAAANIRIELKAAFPSIKFSVTSDFNAVNIYWTDGPSSSQVDGIVQKYKAGDFDGMTDCYDYAKNRHWPEEFGDVRYVFSNRSRTIEGMREAWKRDGNDPAEIGDDWFLKNRAYGETERVNRVYFATDLTSIYEAPKPKLKSDGPHWSKPGKKGFRYLATDDSGWQREFRSDKTVLAEVAKLESLGYKVEVAGGYRSNSRFIRLLSEPVADSAPVEVVIQAAQQSETNPAEYDFAELAWL